MTVVEAINKVIAIAKNEIGYLEKRTNSNLDSKTGNAGSNNYTKYWRDIAVSFQGQAWCACFITWCFVQAFGKEMATKLLKHYPYISCWKISTLFSLHSTPTVGDIVIFYRNGTFAHTGIVTGVSGTYFTTVEGNTSGGNTIIANGGGVCSKGYYLSNLPGTKFITPDWSLLTGSSISVDKVVTEDYNATGIANVSDYLNVRSIPSVSGDFLARFNKGDIIYINGKCDNGWLRCKIYDGSNGYVMGSYVKNIVETSKKLDYTKASDVIEYLSVKGIITDKELWIKYCKTDANVFCFCQKLCQYITTKKVKETADRMYEGIDEILWDLKHRGIISDSDLWRQYINKDKNIFYLFQKSLHYCRTH